MIFMGDSNVDFPRFLHRTLNSAIELHLPSLEVFESIVWPDPAGLLIFVGEFLLELLEHEKCSKTFSRHPEATRHFMFGETWQPRNCEKDRKKAEKSNADEYIC